MLGLVHAPLFRLDDDVRAVQHAAALLRIPEFAFFHVAYRRWFGQPAADPLIEPYFMRYLFTHQMPAWVRHLARQVLACSQTGADLPGEFGVQPALPPRPSKGRAQQLCQLGLAVFYAACFGLITYYAL